jgi:hypothetical protein
MSLLDHNVDWTKVLEPGKTYKIIYAVNQESWSERRQYVGNKEEPDLLTFFSERTNKFTYIPNAYLLMVEQYKESKDEES